MACLRRARHFETNALFVVAAIFLFSCRNGSLTADDDPPTEADVQQLMESKPLNSETWPEWRDYYVRLEHAYDVAAPDDFYYALRSFVGGLATGELDQLPAGFANDPVALVVLAGYLADEHPERPRRALVVARQALASGDPQGIATSRLARHLITVAGAEKGRDSLSPEGNQLLAEASELLDQLATSYPQARLKIMRGLIALHRDEPNALDLLKQGADESPVQSGFAVNYLSMFVAQPNSPGEFAETTAEYLRRYPDHAHVKALHAIALFRDGRHLDAYQAWQAARQASDKVVKFLGPAAVAALEDGQWVTPTVAEGMDFLKMKQFHSAAAKFRAAVADDPLNHLAAKLLARSLVNDAFLSRSRENSPAMQKLIAECSRLCEQYPQDPDIQLAQALLLNHAGKRIAAEAALAKAEQLGVQHQQVPGFDYVREIRDGARTERLQNTTGLSLLGIIGVFVSWLACMFLLGSLMAICTPRTPRYTLLTGSSFSTGEIWLQRFYLLVLSLSLVVFYLSVPFVAAGLLAITLVLFGIMLLLRFIHFGILHRGLYAIWGVLRCAFLGPSPEVFGLEVSEQEQPRLFQTLQEVATKLETNTVDRAYLTPDSQLSVHESGTGPFGLFGRRRVISIGVSTLSSLSLSEFKAVLAHEYGHFSHQDTFYSRFISQVTSSLVNSLAVMQVAGGFINYINPFYWFYWLYLRAYSLLAAGFSRSREFLADRRAALAYGKEPFISGLTKVSLESVMFSGISIQNIRSELSQGRAYLNVFDAQRQFRDQPEMTEPTRKLLEDMHSAKPTWFDSHPTLRERVEAVRSLADARETRDETSAADLIDSLPVLEEQLTELLTEFVQQNFDIIQVPQG